MTGEIAAAAAITGQVVKVAKDKQAVNKLVDAELVAAAKETEHFKEAATMRAKRIALKEAVVLKLFAPPWQTCRRRRRVFQS